MKQRRSVVTFALALFAFTAVGAGAVVLLPVGPLRSAGPHHAKTAAALQWADATVVTATTSPEAATPQAAATATGNTQFPLIADQAAIARPGQPNRLVIPGIGLDARVVEVGTVLDKGKPVWDTAAFAVGYHRGSAQPGSKGNTVMAGHISSPVSKKGDIFRHLPEVRIGDRIDVYVGGQSEKKVSYEVSEVRLVAPTAIQVLAPTPDATLTLLTCYPDNVYNKRLVVIGKLAG